ncbi:hypothetical protein AJ80_09423 [Polytolypa hystricis UAMH7299]|uniref:DUF7730 domain-containing protein n=1 Tax=Polytolypa hystricis (strain UAMH7299) TaxID=1447883 RepID=A0A2B7WI36_POLH7|nr:hypothetical protein AJ80_09423 [Polytolypa hystricis UAMH7299]
MSTPSSSPSFPFLKLPLELREQVYRHLFWIYPGYRCHLGHAYLTPNRDEEKHTTKVYEVSKHPENPTEKDYSRRSYHYEPAAEIVKRGIYRETCDVFLAIFHANKAVYAEAMRVFYGETFFIASMELWDAIRFLTPIGAHRRKLLRHLSFEFWGSYVAQECGGWVEMRDIANLLVDSDRMETIEIRAIGISVELDMLESARCAGTRTEYQPVVFSGLHEFCRLKFLGTLRLVADKSRLMSNYPQDLEWLRKLEEREWEGTERKTRVLWCSYARDD